MIARHQLKDKIWAYLKKQFETKLEDVDNLTFEGIKEGLKDKTITNDELSNKLQELKTDGSIVEKNIAFVIYCPKDLVEKLPNNYKKHFYSDPDNFILLVLGVISLYFILYFFNFNIVERINITNNFTFIACGLLLTSIIILCGGLLMTLYNKASERFYLLKLFKGFFIYFLVSLVGIFILYFIVNYIVKFEDLTLNHFLTIIGISITTAAILLKIMPFKSEK